MRRESGRVMGCKTGGRAQTRRRGGRTAIAVQVKPIERPPAHGFTPLLRRNGARAATVTSAAAAPVAAIAVAAVIFVFFCLIKVPLRRRPLAAGSVWNRLNAKYNEVHTGRKGGREAVNINPYNTVSAKALTKRLTRC